MTDNSVVLVAIPAKDDYVWKISSEKVPHMTVLYLNSHIDNIARVTDYIQHVVDTTMRKFYMSVKERGILGDKSADVLFLDSYYSKMLTELRTYLLDNPDIRTAYDSVEQYETWTPHLTLGYPETPAKPDNRDYPGIHSICFDRLALWTGDYEGIEFPLKSDDYADIAHMTRIGQTFLAHHGIKGQKWGVRHDPETEGTVHRSSPLKIDSGIDSNLKKSAASVATLMGERYGFHIGEIKLIPKDHIGNEPDTLGFVEPAEGATTSVSTIFVKKGSIRPALKHAESVGWFANGCGTEKAFLTHESAHALFHINDRLKNGLLSQRLVGNNIKARDKAMQAAVKAARKDGIPHVHMLSHVSGYAYSAGTRQELEAELFSQYHWMPNPPRFVKVWGETLHQELGIDPTPFKEGTP